MKKLMRSLILGCLTLCLVVVPGLAQASLPSGVGQVQPVNGPIDEPIDEPIDGLIEQGKVLYRRGDWNGAIATWQSTLNQPHISPRQQATLWIYLGMAHQKQGDGPATTAALDTGLQLLESLPVAVGLPLRAQALNAQGQLALDRGQAEVAFTHWQQTTQIYRTLDYPQGITGSLLNQASALEMTGHYRRACQTILTAIALGEQSCDLQAPETMAKILAALDAQTDPALALLAMTRLGNVLRHSGYLTQAQRILERAQALGNTMGHTPGNTMGTVLLSLGQVEQARYRQALYLYEQTGDSLDDVIAFASQALGHYRAVLDLTQGDSSLGVQAAVQNLTLLTQLQTAPAPVRERMQPRVSIQIQTQLQGLKQLPLAQLAPTRPLLLSQISWAQTLITLWASGKGDNPLIQPPVDILPLLRRIQAQAADLGDRDAQSQGLGTLGHLHEVLGQATQATQTTQAALALAQSIGAEHLTYRWQWQLGRLSRSAPAQALPYYQAAVDSLDQVRRDLLAVETDVRFLLRDTVEPLYRELVTLLLESPAPSQANLKQAVREIDALQLARLEDFLSCNLTPQVALDQAPLDPTAAVVYPIVLPDQLAVVVRLPQSNEVQFYRTPLSVEEINRTLDSLRIQMEKPFLSEQFFTLSQQVYDWLIRPLEPTLAAQAVDTLVFVSDGGLRNVPMAALHDGQRFLIERYGVALSPSLRLPVSQPLAEVGLDTLSFGLSKIRPNFSPHAGFNALINVERELMSIQAQVPGQSLLNQRFTRENLQTFVDDDPAAVLHLATHGQFSSNPEETFLLSWDRRLGLGELREILSRRTGGRTIELLILSACKTAVGDSRATLGLAGMAIQSGARSTIASLWNVNDLATSELMRYLYEALASSDSPVGRAQALRQAQVRLLHTPGYQAPLYWAAYVLVGNWQ